MCDESEHDNIGTAGSLGDSSSNRGKTKDSKNAPKALILDVKSKDIKGIDASPGQVTSKDSNGGSDGESDDSNGDNSNGDDSKGDGEKDIFRDSLLRYMGYANEVGESFRSVVPLKYVIASYVASSGYVLADTFSKTLKTWKESSSLPTVDRTMKTGAMSLDVLLWQSLASVIIPGFTINRICAASRYLLPKTGLLGCGRRATYLTKWVTVAIGLMSIPLIIHPIDHAVDFTMDRTIRPLIGTETKTK